MTDSNPKKNFVRKAGRTLLVKVLGGEFKPETLNLEGLTNSHYTEKSNSYFLTFDSAPNSLNALRLVRKDFSTSVRAKIAHYRVFFTVENLNDSVEYNTVKTQHRDMVQNGNNSSVLYYKLYRKNGKYLGCGEMTLDTKEGLDHLMSDDGLKTFNLECGVSGTHYRYRTQNSTDHELTASVTASA